MSKKILVVDDEVDFLEITKVALEFEGYEVVTASDGIKALEVSAAEKPDLILLDIMMPALNGYQVCRELRAQSEFANVPIVLLTAKSRESDKFWGAEVGATEYLTKPVEHKVLFKTIKKYLS